MARILVAAFTDLAPDAWSTIDAARAEVEESLGLDRIGRAALGAVPWRYEVRRGP